MNKVLKTIIVSLIEKLDYHNLGRKNKKQIHHYVDTIFHVLKSGIQWNCLTQELHYTTYHKKFIKWSSLNIFKLAYKAIIKMLKKNKVLNKNTTKNLFIDSSMIKNIRGVDLLGKNHYDIYRNGNKVTIIVTEKGIPLSIVVNKASKHDTQIVETSINNLTIKYVGTRIIGDKGYNSKQLKEKLNKSKINLIYPYKKNQKCKNSNKHKQLLRKRHIVENVFSWIKNYKRLILRYEINISNYLSLWFIAVSNLILNKKLF